MTKDFDLYLAVAIGGAIGASARYAIELAIPFRYDSWPTATFVVNLSGAFVLGMVIVIANAFWPDPKAGDLARRVRPFVVTGILGGYTTFSTYISEAHGLMIENPRPEIGLGVLYLVASVVFGLVCVFLGMAFMQVVLRSRLAAQSAAAEQAEQAQTVETEDEA